MPCWIHVVGLLACLALAVAQAPTPAASTPALALPAASAAGEADLTGHLQWVVTYSRSMQQDTPGPEHA
jgi:hypothetical protein